MITEAIIGLVQQVYGPYAKPKRRPMWTIEGVIRQDAHNDREGCYLTGQRMAAFLNAEGYEAVNCLGDSMDISSAKLIRFDSLDEGVIWVTWCWGPYVPINVRKR